MSSLKLFRDPHTGLISIKSADQEECYYSPGEINDLIDQGDKKLERYFEEFKTGVKDAD